MGLISAGICDIGLKRKTNQDSIYMNPEKNIFIVADGMGGHNGGDIASALAVKHMPEFLLENEQMEAEELLKQGIACANQKIKERGKQDPMLKGMGTTVVSMLFRETSLFIANVGDSRSYLINRHHIYQLSKDHSLVQEKLNIGFYNREQAAKDPQKNVLVRTVGFEEEVEIDVFRYKVSKNDIFIICSDGLHGKVSDADILYLVNQNIPDPAQTTPEAVSRTAQNLVDQANKNGGQDNISVIIVVAQ